MMPPNKDQKGLLYGFYYWWLIFVGIVMAGILGNYWAELGAGLTLLILIWATIKIKKKWLYPIEELCDLLFVNTDKIGNKHSRRTLNVTPNKNLQNIPIFLCTNNKKTIYSLIISFGAEKTYFKKVKNILVNRLRLKRLKTAPSPYWWSDFRTPALETKPHQPKIKRLIGVYITDRKATSQPIIIYQSFLYDDGYHIVFEEPVDIPLGYRQGKIMQINLELEMGNDWKGMIMLSSNVDRTNLFVTRKVNVSHKYEVKDK